MSYSVILQAPSIGNSVFSLLKFLSYYGVNCYDPERKKQVYTPYRMIMEEPQPKLQSSWGQLSHLNHYYTVQHQINLNIFNLTSLLDAKGDYESIDMQFVHALNLEHQPSQSINQLQTIQSEILTQGGQIITTEESEVSDFQHTDSEN